MLAGYPNRCAEPSSCLCEDAHRRCDGYDVDIAGVGREVDAITGWKERIEALYKVWIALKEGRYSFNNSRRVNPVVRPKVSQRRPRSEQGRENNTVRSSLPNKYPEVAKE